MELTATLATAARSGTATSPVLLTLGREWPTDSDRLSRALDALESTAWVSPSDLSSAAAASAGSLTLASSSAGDDRVDQLRRLVDGERDVVSFASALDDPADLTAPARLSLLALSSNAWRGDTGDLTVAIDRFPAQQEARERSRRVNDLFQLLTMMEGLAQRFFESHRGLKAAVELLAQEND